jgi:putative transposase
MEGGRPDRREHGVCGMNGDKEIDSLPKRRYPAHHAPVERDNAPIILFCTVCIIERAALLNNTAAVNAVRLSWQEAAQWRVGEFLCMPDHLHLFCVPGVPQPESVKHWCRYWKRQAGQHLPALKGQWQMDVWDTQMRDADHYTEKLSYMRQNPVRRGLAGHWEDWPHRGVLHTIRW